MIDAKRLPGWRARLAVALAQNEAKPFAWGTNDCFGGLVAPVVHALIGVDLAEPARGKYASEDDGLKLLTDAGYASLVDFVAQQFPEIPPALAHVGDIAVIDREGDKFGGVLGVVIGERIVSMHEGGRGTVKLTRATRAFRVGA